MSLFKVQNSAFMIVNHTYYYMFFYYYLYGPKYVGSLWDSKINLTKCKR